MRAEVKKMDEYSERIRFLCKYKIETMSDVDNIKEQKQEELQKVLNIFETLIRWKNWNDTCKMF